MEDMERKLAVMQKMITEIHHVVIGSDHDKESGLLERVKYLEDRQERQEKFINKIVWICVGMSIPSSYGIIAVITKIAGLKF